MKAILITHPGFEDISALEIKELINKESKMEKSVVIFETNKYEDLVKLAYKSQSASKILILLDKIKINKMGDLNKLKIDLKDWIDKKSNFKIKCKRIGKHDFKSKEIEEEVGGLVIDKYNLKVNLTNPDLIVYTYIYEENVYVGIDIIGIELSKRDYKIFHHPDSIKGTIAYALLRIGGFKKGQKLIDPFCSNGTIIIEAGLFASNKAVRFFDKEKFLFKTLKHFEKLDFDKLFDSYDSNYNNKKLDVIGSENLLRYVNSCKKNAKIAGIEKNVDFRRYDIEWLDTKFNKKEVDLVVSKIIEPGKSFDKKKIEKIYNELFYHLDFILNKRGKIVLLCRKKDLIEEKATKYNFKVKVNREIKIGDCKFYILEISKQVNKIKKK